MLKDLNTSPAELSTVTAHSNLSSEKVAKNITDINTSEVEFTETTSKPFSRNELTTKTLDQTTMRRQQTTFMKTKKVIKTTNLSNRKTTMTRESSTTSENQPFEKTSNEVTINKSNIKNITNNDPNMSIAQPITLQTLKPLHSSTSKKTTTMKQYISNKTQEMSLSTVNPKPPNTFITAVQNTSIKQQITLQTLKPIKSSTSQNQNLAYTNKHAGNNTSALLQTSKLTTMEILPKTTLELIESKTSNRPSITLQTIKPLHSSTSSNGTPTFEGETSPRQPITLQTLKPLKSSTSQSHKSEATNKHTSKKTSNASLAQTTGSSNEKTSIQQAITLQTIKTLNSSPKTSSKQPTTLQTLKPISRAALTTFKVLTPETSSSQHITLQTLKPLKSSTPQSRNSEATDKHTSKKTSITSLAKSSSGSFNEETSIKQAITLQTIKTLHSSPKTSFKQPTTLQTLKPISRAAPTTFKVLTPETSYSQHITLQILKPLKSSTSQGHKSEATTEKQVHNFADSETFKFINISKSFVRNN